MIHLLPTSAIVLYWWLLAFHFLADFPLQGEFLARAKKFIGVPGVPWIWPLVAHAVIHGWFVSLATGSIRLGLLEAFFHALIDYGKCAGKYNFRADQWMHIFCKVFWVVLAGMGV